MCHCAAFSLTSSSTFLLPRFSLCGRQDKEGLYPLTVNSVMTDPHALVLYAVPHVIQVRALLFTHSSTAHLPRTQCSLSDHRQPSHPLSHSVRMILPPLCGAMYTNAVRVPPVAVVIIRPRTSRLLRGRGRRHGGRRRQGPARRGRRDRARPRRAGHLVERAQRRVGIRNS